MEGIQGIGSNLTTQNVEKTDLKDVEQVQALGVKGVQLEKTPKADTLEKSAPVKTTEEKQAMLKKARKQGAGWSILGGLITTAYYALRSDKTVAKKYNLDEKQDKNLISQIKKEQTLWSLSGAFGFGIVGFLVANVLDSKNIKVEE